MVVGVHWGVEDSHKITQTQRDLAQQLSDWGADVILGTHPHVVQDAEWKTSVDGRQTFVAIPWEISSAPKANRINSSVPS